MVEVRRFRYGLTAWLTLLLATVPGRSQQVRVLIPPFHGTTLAGSPVSLPEMLHGRTAVLVVGFSQASRDEVSDWGKRLASDFYQSSVPYYEIAMLQDVPRLLRGLVTRRIREQVSQRGAQHFVPVADHEDDWKTASGYTTPDSAYVLLIDSSGAVAWRTGGAFSEAKYAELVSRLHSMQRVP